MGIHWTGIVFGLGGAIACGYWTTDFLVVQRAHGGQRLCARPKWRPSSAPISKWPCRFIVILPGLLGLAVLPFKLVPENAVGPGLHSYNEVVAPHAGALLRAGTAGTGNYRADCGIHVGNGGQRHRLRHRLDV